MEELKKYLLHLKVQAGEDLDALPEIFNDPADAEAFNYYDGFITALNVVINFVETI